MSLLVLGVSHHSAPIEVLEKVAAIDVDQAMDDLSSADAVAEALLLSTCNRVEIYTDVARFHAAVESLTSLLAKSAGLSTDHLAAHLYVHYEDAAVRHAFRVTSGLDSMVMGDEQILGQFREAFKTAVDRGWAGRNLHELAQDALRVGKLAHTDTEIGRHGASIVAVALSEVARHFGSLAGMRVAVIGSGAMSSLAAQLAHAQGAELTIIGRTPESVTRLAETVSGEGADMSGVDEQLRTADVIVSATGATGLLLTADRVETARMGVTKPLFICDLALPHDTDPGIAALAGVTRLDLPGIADLPEAHVAGEAVAAAELLVMEATADYVQRRNSAKVEPVVVALRTRAEEVVMEELQRLRSRTSHLTDDDFTQVARSMRRVVATLLHTPTVRMKEFAVDPGGDRYAAALHALFDLDPSAVQALTDNPGGTAGA